MDTRFELNIKRVNIKGDNRYLYLYFDEKLALKLEYKDIETVIGFLVRKAQQQQLQSSEPLMLDDEATLPDSE